MIGWVDGTGPALLRADSVVVHGRGTPHLCRPSLEPSGPGLVLDASLLIVEVQVRVVRESHFEPEAPVASGGLPETEANYLHVDPGLPA